MIGIKKSRKKLERRCAALCVLSHLFLFFPGEIFTLPPEKLSSSVGFVPRPAQIQGFHPKTVIVRMNSSGTILGANPVGGSFMRLAFGMPALEAQTLLPVKTDCEEMESEEMVIHSSKM